MIEPAAILAGFGLGLGLGVVTGLPLGVVNVAVVVTAVRRGRRAATWVGLGGAVADGIHATLAFSGLAALLATRPQASAALALVAGLILCAAAVMLVRGRTDASAERTDRAAGRRPFALGLAMTLPNPAALTAWAVWRLGAAAHSRPVGWVAAVLWALHPMAAYLPVRDRAAAIATAIGVTIGSAGYFAALAAVAARAGVDTPPRRRAVTVIAAVVVGGLGVVALVRGAWALAR